VLAWGRPRTICTGIVARPDTGSRTTEPTATSEATATSEQSARYEPAATSEETAGSQPPGAQPQTGPVLIAFNGSPAAEHALAAVARLLAERRALVLVVWKSGLGFDLLELPTVTGLPPAPIDVRTALEIDESQYESAQRLARQGAEIARDAGLQAEALVVAEAPEISISETIVRVADERRSSAVVVGEQAHGRLGELFLGRVSRDVIRYAPCPVVVVRHAA
jgi:nucleotide-binding universal stress UspA family protein